MAEDNWLAQAQTPIYSEPRVFVPTQQDRSDARNVVQNTPAPTDPTRTYSLPSDINNAGGQIGNGYANADEAARAVSRSLYDHTRTTGHEAGAWIVSKPVDGQDRFFVVAASSGQQNELDMVQAKSDLDNYRRNNPGENFTVVSHIHSHPNITRDANGKPLGLIGEGPSVNDYDIWRNASIDQDPKDRIQNRGYIVSGDGDVYRLDIPNQNNLSAAEQRGAPFGIYTAQSTPTLTNIGDVALDQETQLRPNLWGAIRDRNDPNVGQQAAWLDPQQVRNGVSLLSDTSHPDHKMYTQAQQALAGLDPKISGLKNPSEQLDNTAAALVLDARRAGMTQIDSVEPSKDGTKLFAMQNSPLGPEHALHGRDGVNKAQAASQSVENTSLQLLNEAPNLPQPKNNQTRSQTQEIEPPLAEVTARSR
jgi:hypothetical protein